MASLIDRFKGNAPSMMNAYVSAVNTKMNAFPPLMKLGKSSTARRDNYTAGALLQMDLTTRWSSTDTSYSNMITSMNRGTRAAWTIMSKYYASSQNATSSSSTVASKRRALSSTMKSTTNATNILGTIAKGLKGAMTVTHELFTGKAHRNATGTTGDNTTQTIVKWEPRVNRTVYLMARRRKGDWTTSPVTIQRAGQAPRTFIGQSLTTHWTAMAKARDGIKQRMHKTLNLTLVYYQAAHNLDVSRNPVEQARRLSEVRAEMTGMWAKGSRAGDKRRAFTISSALNGTNCLSGSQALCEQCYILDQYVGYLIIFFTRIWETYTNTAPYPWNNWDATYETCDVSPLLSFYYTWDNKAFSWTRWARSIVRLSSIKWSLAMCSS